MRAAAANAVEGRERPGKRLPLAAMLGTNPVRYLLSQHGALSSLTPANRTLFTGREFFPDLISGPFHHGLVLVFAVSAALGLIAASQGHVIGRARLDGTYEIR